MASTSDINAQNARQRLLQVMLHEIESGDYLNSDHMEKFGEILEATTTYRHVCTLYIQHLENVQPASIPHIQILFSSGQTHQNQVGHWIVAYHDGSSLSIYDSLNDSRLTPDQEGFVSRLFPDLPIVPKFVFVQQQGNLIDCGVFAIANATSLALGLDPAQQQYNVSLMRPHLADIIRSGHLMPFPTLPTSFTSSIFILPLSKVPKTDEFPPLLPPRRIGRPLKKPLGRSKTSPVSLDEQRRTALKRYVEAHPEVNQKAVAKYSATHPDVNIASAKRYRNTNQTEIKKNKKIKRAIPQTLQQSKFIGLYSDDELTNIEVYCLKQPCLISLNVYKCKHCGAALFDEEKGRDKWCCGQGAYHYNILPSLDAPFYENEVFLKDSRSYNNLFSFSAIGVSGGFQTYTKGVSFVKILGRTYHRVFDLSWQAGPNNCGMYIDDGQERMRLAAGRALDVSVVRDITNYLNDVNPFIPVLRRLGLETSEQAHIVFQQTTRQAHGPVLGDVPRSNEIAAVLNTDATQYTPREVVVWKKGVGKPHTVNTFHPSYECLQYPLLFPHGSEGWFINKKDKTGKKISQVKYYRHLLLSNPRFTNMRRLSQEYFVDMFCRVEEERLKFISNNQGSVLRIATRNEIDETVAGEGGVQVGRVYLPSSFTNSPRYMQVKYQDGMAIVHRLGKPTYFLTVTCNPKWKEIHLSLNKGEYAIDRPDLCNRVFQLKLKFLLNEIKSGKVFGNLVYILHVVEFQKRGLPHAHICFKVEGSGPVHNNEIDSVVKATIPKTNEKLKELVIEHMIHGPACTTRKDLPCVDKNTNKCTKKYPKSETENTHIDDRGFVSYKRSAANTFSVKRGSKDYTISDCDVVPYNPALLLQMECHLNLEIASTRKIVKYLFKYIHKGPDAVKVNIISDRLKDTNEIENYVTRRYIGASDAVWRILEFDITGRYPSVIQLPVHLPNKDLVVYKPGNEQTALEKSKSKLMLYMERPKSNEIAKLTYCEFFENYILDTKSNSKSLPTKVDKYFVSPRQRGLVVARIYWVSPALGELYYLRMLLQRFSCVSFEDLRTVDGDTFPTFQEAARAVGLLNEEDEFREALTDASLFMVGRRLRHFYFILISNGAPAITLWESFKYTLCEDLIEQFPEDPERALMIGLCEIDRILRNHGSCLEDMGLPRVPDVTTEVGRESLKWSAKACLDFVNEWVPKLNDDQLYTFHLLKETWEKKLPKKVFFIDGAGGTGKTLLLNVITSYFRSLNKTVLCTASTGVAALLHDGGVTAHSKFKLPVDVNNTSAHWSISGNSQRAELIRSSCLIIWDEAPMAHKTTIDIFDRSLQNLLELNEPFGGKLVIFSGDFRQIPPVIPAGTPSDSISVTIKQSKYWSYMHKLNLNILQRSKNDLPFSKFVLSVGDGTVEKTQINKLSLIPLQNIGFVNTLQELIDFVYPLEMVGNPDECCGRAILSGTNANTKDINSLILNLLPGESVDLLSADTCATDSTDDEVIHTELLNTITQPRIPDHRLVLKVGAVCILLRNLCFDDKLVNGTKLIITAISRFCITTRRPHSQDVLFIPRILFKFSAGTSGMEIIRRQFPLQLAYGITINKSQGQTLNVVGVDLRSDVFAHGQLYVALSRVRTSDNIRVLVAPERVVNGVAYCANVVYRQLLL